MKVLSLFDGMSCGQIALNRIGIVPEMYFASEIKNHAIKVTKHNFPNTIHVGDVRGVSFKDGVLITDNGTYNVGSIDLLIGGSPCQDLSILMSNRSGLNGDKSSLFWEYHRILSEIKPKFFMLENVGSMDNESIKSITNALGVDGVRINSELISAQLRDRIFWTNIPGKSKNLFSNTQIEQPIDKKITFQSILESGSTLREKSLCLTARGGGRWEHVLKENKYKKPNVQKQLIDRNLKGFDNIVFEDDHVRLLTQKEMERLQTVPEGYTSCLSYVDAANVLGDGWTIDVICHIFNGLK